MRLNLKLFQTEQFEELSQIRPSSLKRIGIVILVHACVFIFYFFCNYHKIIRKTLGIIVIIMRNIQVLK